MLESAIFVLAGIKYWIDVQIVTVECCPMQ
jgi:hypothetical protein